MTISVAVSAFQDLLVNFGPLLILNQSGLPMLCAGERSPGQQQQNLTPQLKLEPTHVHEQNTNIPPRRQMYNSVQYWPWLPHPE